MNKKFCDNPDCKAEITDDYYTIYRVQYSPTLMGEETCTSGRDLDLCGDCAYNRGIGEMWHQRNRPSVTHYSPQHRVPFDNEPQA